jgi:beta-lactamase class A
MKIDPHPGSIVRNIRLFLPAVLLLGFGLGLIADRYIRQPVIIRPTVLREGGYQFINPVLLCNTDPAVKVNEDTSLEKNISSYLSIADEQDVALFYINLKTGKWAGHDENESFSPASMLKVPTVVSALQYSESHPGFLSQEILYDGSFDDNAAEHFKPKQSIQAGHSYSIEDLLAYTIQDSDNNAVRLIHEAFPAEDLQQIYSALNIPLSSTSADFMSPKTYLLFLRVLYNSTYLSRDSSEKVLKLMSGGNFPQGIAGGVPEGITVSQKFGERQVQDEQGNISSRELHDCGIVYAPAGPYMLCVMTRGSDFETLAREIKDVSKLVYDRQGQ